MKDYRSRLASLIILMLIISCETKKMDDQQRIREISFSRTLGLAYMEENKLSDAETEFLKLIELAPNESSGYANLGLVYLRMGKYPEAEEQLVKAVKLSPDDADIRLILAKVYELTNREEQAIQEMEVNLKNDPWHLKTIYSLADFYTKTSDPESMEKREMYLRQVVEKAPKNIVARLQLIDVLIKKDKLDESLANMEELKRQYPEPPPDAIEFYEKTVFHLRSGNGEEALKNSMIFHNFLKLTSLYQAGILEVKGPGGPLIGFPIFTFGQSVERLAQEGESIVDVIRFTDITSTANLNVPVKPVNLNNNGSVVISADFDNDGDTDIYFECAEKLPSGMFHALYRNEMGRFEDIAGNAGIRHSGPSRSALFADYDNDGHLDLYVLREGANILYRNTGNGQFEDLSGDSGINDTGTGKVASFADIDHDGDLDLLLGNDDHFRLYRNNGDGSFEENTERSGINGKGLNCSDISFADFDDDGDLDFLVSTINSGHYLFTNLRQGRYENITAPAGLASKTQTKTFALGDYSNDGFVDLFLCPGKDNNGGFYLNNGDGTFTADEKNNSVLSELSSFNGTDSEFLDFDNDGFLDLVVSGIPSGNSSSLILYHHEEDGKFRPAQQLIPPGQPPLRQLSVTDYNEDGDPDLLISGFDGTLRLLRNDGGNMNHYIKIQLVGLRTGSGKNNHFGLGAKLEVRAADLYQMKMVTEPTILFGLGPHKKADVVRIVWSNGVPQNIFAPSSDQDLVEEQVLKGSCPFLYTWNGREYVFVKDMMWRSALGMPMGIMGGKTTFAFADASEEYLKIPGEHLKPKSGYYEIQVTAELWETIYMDKIQLYCVDHPEEVEIYVDEKFSPPPFPSRKIYAIRDQIIPLSACDETGTDLTSLISHKDGKYIASFNPGTFQGITESHDLILDLSNNPDDRHLHLFLNGWIFPTDASINVNISQNKKMGIIPPSLAVQNSKGEWETVIRDIGFPMGKDKMVIVNLSGQFLSSTKKIRIRTNMQIYWDHIFTAHPDDGITVQVMSLPLESADLHFRGYSAMYRKDGRYGPHWFDYNQVSGNPKWRDLVGNYTRYGDVTPLLSESDNRYIIANAGDETTVRFKSAGNQIPPGFKRDFIIFSVGWVKDGDLNTATGQTVEPLPFHGMTSYPYGPDEKYPVDREYVEYLEKYNTRFVDYTSFREALKIKPVQQP